MNYELRILNYELLIVYYETGVADNQESVFVAGVFL